MSTIINNESNLNKPFNIKKEVKKIKSEIKELKIKINEINETLKDIHNILLNHKQFIEFHYNESCE